MYGERLASETTLSMSDVPKAFWRSLCFATSPLETLVNTLLIWSTSSRLVSLENPTSVP